jgi:hypothetical protein
VSKPKPTGRPHLFVRDPDVPPDHNGRGACSECHLVGRPGDAHHTLPELHDAQVVHRNRYEGGEAG